MKTPQSHQVDRTHADDHVPGLRRLDDAVRAGNHVFGLCGRVHHGDDDARLPRSIGRAGGGSRPEFHEASDLGVVDVAHHQRVALLQQVLGHGPAHHAKADKGDGLLSCLLAHLHLLISRWSRVLAALQEPQCKPDANTPAQGVTPFSCASAPHRVICVRRANMCPRIRHENGL
ncbi:hypothetical protein D3C86_1532520 [compost metagenome]